MKKLIPLLSGFALVACQMNNNPVLDHLPPSKILEEGIANKYYNHFKPYDNTLEQRTRLSYATYQLLENEVLEVKNFNAGFELVGWQYFHIAEASLHVDSAWYIANGDTLEVRIEAGAVKNFSDSASSFYKENYNYQDQEHQYISHQFNRIDTLIEAKKGLQFSFNRSYRNLEIDSTLNDWKAKEIYLQGLGFYYGWEQGNDGIFETELIEQMPLSDFKQRAKHGEKRVAYIDPNKTLGSNVDFNLCGEEKSIADYYNGEPDAAYSEGKKALVNHLKKEVDPSIFENFEGMLTFRFVISCQGKAGRFIAEAYDFNYQKQSLPEKAVKGVFEFLNNLESWQPTVIRGENRDSYAYITLKIKDATIIDILP